MAAVKKPASKKIKTQIKSLRKGLNSDLKLTKFVKRKTDRVAAKTVKMDSDLDKMKKDLDFLKSKKNVKRSPKSHSAYNLFVGSQLKQGKTFKDAVSAWKNRNKKKTITRTITKIVKADKKPHSAYNLFIGSQMKEGKTFKQAVSAWKNRNKKKTITKIVKSKPKIKYRTRTLTKIVKAKPKVVAKVVHGKPRIRHRARFVKGKIPTQVKPFDEDSFFKKFGESIADSFSKFSEKIGERFDIVEEKFTERFDKVDERIGSLENRVASLESKPAGIDSELVKEIGEKQDSLLRKLDRLIVVLSQQPFQNNPVADKIEEKTEEKVFAQTAERKLLDNATPQEKALAYDITETYFEDVARMGLKRNLDLDEVIQTYKNVLSEVKTKNAQISSNGQAEKSVIAVQAVKTAAKEGEQ